MVKSHHLEHRNSQRLTDGCSVEKPTQGLPKSHADVTGGTSPVVPAHGLTDEAVEHGVLRVVGGDGVLPVHYAQLRPVFKRVLPEAQQVQDAAQCLRAEGGWSWRGVTGPPSSDPEGGQGSVWSDSP